MYAWSSHLIYFYKDDEEKKEDDEEEAVEDLAVDVEDAEDEELVEGGSGPHTKSNLMRSFLDAIFDWIPFSFSLNAFSPHDQKFS